MRDIIILRLCSNEMYNLMSDKPKKVFNLRKRPSSSHKIQPRVPEPHKSSKPPSVEGFHPETLSRLPQQSILAIHQQKIPELQGPDLFLQRSFIQFQSLIGKVDTQILKITNRGSTSIYYQWIKVPKSNINPSAVYDVTPKFSCLNTNNTIKPGESIIFPFSFFSQIPGFFSEEYEFRCQPTPQNTIPLIKLEGKAFVVDQFAAARMQLSSDLNTNYIDKCVREIISDIIDAVKSPQPPLPDLTQPEVAQREFESVNLSLGISYNPLIFSWWMGLHQDTLQALSLQPQQQWDLNIKQLKQQINSIKDEATKQLFQYRYNHYFYLSQNPQLDRSVLYKDIFSMLQQVAESIGGVFNDNTRKELEMWEVNWRYPEEEQTPEQKKVKDDEVAKIKAEWLKKAKKKKWNQEQEKILMNDYRTKMSAKVKESMLDYFDSYEEKAAYIKTNEILSKSPLTTEYFRFLERLKTIQEVDIENKKVLVKFQLLTNPNTEEKIHQYKEYLEKRREYQKRKEEEKREQEKNKDKKKKSKGAVEIEEPIFNITDIFEKDSLESLVQIIRYVQEKSVKMLTLLVNFGPRQIVPNPLFSLTFLHDYLRGVDPMIEFVPHQELENVRNKVEEDNYSDGTIILLQNCNFLPFELGKQEVEEKVDIFFAEQIVDGLSNLRFITDVYVNENKGEKFSGVSMFIEKESVLGIDVWNNISICLKGESSTMIIGGKVTPQKITLIERAMWYSKEIILVGEIGVSFMMVEQGVRDFLDISLSEDKVKAIKNIKQKRDQQWQPDIPFHKRTPRPRMASIVLPVDINVWKKQTEMSSSENILNVSSLIEITESMEDCEVLDLGEETVQKIVSRISAGTYFILEDIHLREDYFRSSEIIYREFYRHKQNRKIRHEEEEKKGINYEADTVLIVVNDLTFLDERVELVEKKKVQAVERQDDGEEKQEQQEQEEVEIEQEEEEEEQEEQQKNKKKLRNLPDFQLRSSSYPIQVLSGVINPVFSRVQRYPRSDLD